MGNAVLNGTLTDDGGEVCDFRFQYGLTAALGTTTPWIPGAASADAFSRLITGLPGNTNYFFRAEVRNAAGTTVGAILNFITTKPALASVAALAATAITDHGATLNGVVEVDGGRAGAVRFGYGLTTAYGMITPWQQGFVTGDTFTAAVERLAEGQAYHFRAEFASSPGVHSRDLTFSTLSDLGGVCFIDDELLRILEAA